MKIEINNAKPKFKPIKIVITVESQKEKEMLMEMVNKNVTIPDSLSRKYSRICYDFLGVLKNHLDDCIE